VIPILNIGAAAVHVPFHTTWAHEIVPEEEHPNNHLTLNSLKDLLNYLN
jgi:putative hydrolase of the HAD superfamily